MKRLIFSLLLIVSLSITATAQRAAVFATVAGDTVSTSGSLDTVSKTFTVTAGYASMAIQVNGIKTAGTITSKAYLYSSLDGVTYTLTDSSSAFANSASAQSMYFVKTAPPYVYYKIQVRPPTTSGTTEGLAVKVYYVLRKHD